MSGSNSLEATDALFERYLELGREQGDEAQKAFLQSLDVHKRGGVLAYAAEMEESGGPGLSAGMQLDGFELIEELGQGTTGSVWKARELELDRMVALKILHPYYTLVKEAEARFQREAAATAKLDHPSIVRVYGVGRSGGLSYISYELIEGVGTLADVIGRLRKMVGLPRRHAWEVARGFHQVAEGLQVAHAAGIIHRDLKPGNMMVGREGAPKIADFGLAAVADDPGLSESGTARGTPYYMSPEQAAGVRCAPCSDVFSLGASFYESLTLSRPFAGDSREEVLRAVRYSQPRPMHDFTHAVPRELEVICLKAMEKDPERRYADAGEMAEDLRRWLEDEPILAKPPSPWRRLKLWVKRAPAKAAILASVLLGVSVTWGFAALLLHQNQRLAWENQGSMATIQVLKSFAATFLDQLPPEVAASERTRQELQAVVAAQLPDHPMSRTRALVALGKVYAEREQYDAAMEFLELGLQNQLDATQEVDVRVLRIEWLILGVKMRTGDASEADRQAFLVRAEGILDPGANFLRRIREEQLPDLEGDGP